MYRARSFRYQDDNDDESISKYDTIYYDERMGYLDYGFQRIRKLNLKLFPNYSNIRNLCVDHNSLSELPSPSLLPNLRKLNCSYNKLTSTPFYPKLEILIANNNNIKKLSLYSDSVLTFLECSSNPGIILPTYLPNCTELYATHSSIEEINLSMLPKLKLLDLESNLIKKIGSSDSLIELSIKHNNIISLPYYPNLTRLYASNNRLTHIQTFSNLLVLSVNHNKIQKIDKQPKLTKLNAKNNLLEEIDRMPLLEEVDLSNNNIKSFIGGSYIKNIYIHFNPLITLNLDIKKMNSLELIQIDFSIYCNIHTSYDNYFKKVDVFTSADKIDKIISRVNNQSGILHNKFTEKNIHKLKTNLSIIKFYERTSGLIYAAMKLHSNIYGISITTLKEIIKTDDTFAKILRIVESIYYDSILITIYFNQQHHE